MWIVSDRAEEGPKEGLYSVAVVEQRQGQKNEKEYRV
jgi:hypothetical protein